MTRATILALGVARNRAADAEVAACPPPQRSSRRRKLPHPICSRLEKDKPLMPDESTLPATRDVVIIGGGVMGLFTAYYASAMFDSVTVLDAGRIGDPNTASFGRTRSYRLDYLDPLYTALAAEAISLWQSFEQDTGVRTLVDFGLLNIASTAITPDLETTYARRAHDALTSLGIGSAALHGQALRERYPQVRTDVGFLHRDAGLIDVQAVTAALLERLGQRNVTIVEDAEIKAITSEQDTVQVQTPQQTYLAKSVVVAAGHGTNDVLAALQGCQLRIPLATDRPREAKYITPDSSQHARYTCEQLPVVAYLDCGIYLHPIVQGVTTAVKVGFFDPPDVPRGTSAINSVDEFVAACLPELTTAPSTPVADVDQCDYDLIVGDDDFVLGLVPGHPRICLGVGWRGTGYKYAPLVGRVLGELALRRGTVYDITRFNPARFLDPSATVTP